MENSFHYLINHHTFACPILVDNTIKKQCKTRLSIEPIDFRLTWFTIHPKVLDSLFPSPSSNSRNLEAKGENVREPQLTILSVIDVQFIQYTNTVEFSHE